MTKNHLPNNDTSNNPVDNGVKLALDNVQPDSSNESLRASVLNADTGTAQGIAANMSSLFAFNDAQSTEVGQEKDTGFDSNLGHENNAGEQNNPDEPIHTNETIEFSTVRSPGENLTNDKPQSKSFEQEPQSDATLVGSNQAPVSDGNTAGSGFPGAPQSASTATAPLANSKRAAIETDESLGSTLIETNTTNTSAPKVNVDPAPIANEAGVSAISDSDAGGNSVNENVAVGTSVGITASATDSDGTDSVSYTLSDNAGGLFAIDSNTGEVTVAGALDRETAASHDIEITATSSDGSTSTQNYTIALNDQDEFDVSAVTDTDAGANTLAENATAGSAVGVVASASDADATNSAISYSVDNARFSVDSDGTVRVASGASFDYESETSIDIAVTATSADGSSSVETFTLGVSDISDVAPTDITFSQNAGVSLNEDGGNNAYLSVVDNGDILGGLSALTVEVEFSTSDPGGRDINLFSYHAGGGSDELEIGINEYGSGTGLYLEIGEQAVAINSYDGTQLLDGADHQVSVTWDNASGDWEIFVDGSAVANGTGMAAGQTIAAGGTIVLGQEQDTNGGGFNSAQNFSGTYNEVRIFDDVRTPTEIADNVFSQIPSSEPGLIADWQMDGLANGVVVDEVSGNNLNANFVTGAGWLDSTPTQVVGVSENSAPGTLVTVINATDSEAGETFTYAITNDPSGNFEIVGNEVRVKAGAVLDSEVADEHAITVQVTDSGGNTYTENLTIGVKDVDEFDVSAVTDSDAGANTLTEAAAAGTAVGVVASASDADATNSAISYSVDDSRFSVDSDGTVRVASGASFDYESETSIDITVSATSADGSTSNQTFTLSVSDINETNVSAISDSDAGGNSVNENVAVGTSVGITASATDSDGTDSVSYTLSDNAGGLFAIDSNTGEVTVAGALDRETAASHDIEITATSSDGSTSTQNYTIALNDQDEFDVSAVTDTDAGANTLAENANLIVNGSFETTDVASLQTFNSIDGWTASSGSIEIVDNASIFFGETTSDGEQFLELDADTGVDAVYQDVQTNSGQDYTLSLDVATRSITVDNTIEVYWNGTLVDSIEPNSSTFETHTFSVTGTGGLDRLEFREPASDNDTLGGLIDSVSLVADQEGDAVGIIASATDADATNSDVAYVVDDARFSVDADGTVRIASGANFDYESETSIDIAVTATSADGSSSVETFTVGVTDIDEGIINGGTGNDVLIGAAEDNTFIYEAGDGSDTITGGSGGGWTDAIDLQGMDGSVSISGADVTGQGWTMHLDSGSVVSQTGESLDLGNDSSGTITFDDGAVMSFAEIEQINW